MAETNTDRRVTEQQNLGAFVSILGNNTHAVHMFVTLHLLEYTSQAHTVVQKLCPVQSVKLEKS